MIANLFNTLVGLWLAYMAIFPNGLGMTNRFVLIAAVLTIVLALWARRSDVSTWQSNTAIAAGVLLAVLAVVNQMIHVSDVLMGCSLGGACVSDGVAVGGVIPAVSAGEYRRLMFRRKSRRSIRCVQASPNRAARSSGAATVVAETFSEMGPRSRSAA